MHAVASFKVSKRLPEAIGLTFNQGATAATHVSGPLIRSPNQRAIPGSLAARAGTGGTVAPAVSER